MPASNSQRLAGFADLRDELFPTWRDAGGSICNLSKPAILGIFDAVDTWIDNNAASARAALNGTAAESFTNAQKNKLIFLAITSRLKA